MANDYGRKVTRVARTGGGRTFRGKKPIGWYFTLLMIFAIGIPMVWISRSDRLTVTKTKTSVKAPATTAKPTTTTIKKK